MKTLSPQQAALLAILWDKRWHNSRELAMSPAGIRFGERVHELRKLGYDIQNVVERVEGGKKHSSYRLTSAQAELNLGALEGFSDALQL